MYIWIYIIVGEKWKEKKKKIYLYYYRRRKKEKEKCFKIVYFMLLLKVRGKKLL